MLNTCALAQDSEIYLPDSRAREIYLATSFLDSDEIENLSQAQNLAALGILFGDGRYFSPQSTYTVAYALRLAYRSAGRENEGLEASFNAQMRKDFGLGDYGENAWADGFYMLAVRDLLLTRDEFNEVFKLGTGKYLQNNIATSGMFTKWLCVLNGIKTNSTIFKGDESIDPQVRPYCGGLYLAGIYTMDDVYNCGTDVPVTRDKVAYIFSKFYDFILPAQGIDVYDGEVSKITETKQGYMWRRDIDVKCDEKTVTLRTFFSDNMPVFETLEHEFALLGASETSGSVCDASGALRCGDKVRVYIKDRQIKYVDVTEKTVQGEILPQTSVIRGKIYLYDESGGEIVLENIKDIKTGKEYPGLTGLFSDKNVKIYYNHNQINPQMLNGELSDKMCIAYLKPKYKGGLEKVYSVIIYD